MKEITCEKRTVNTMKKAAFTAAAGVMTVSLSLGALAAPGDMGGNPMGGAPSFGQEIQGSTNMPQMQENGGNMNMPQMQENGGNMNMPQMQENGGNMNMPQMQENGGDTSMPQMRENGGDTSMPQVQENGGDMNMPQMQGTPKGLNLAEITKETEALTDETAKENVENLIAAYKAALENEKTVLSSEDKDEEAAKAAQEAVKTAQEALEAGLKDAGIAQVQENGGDMNMPQMQGTPKGLNLAEITKETEALTDETAKENVENLIAAYKAALENEKTVLSSEDKDEEAAKAAQEAVKTAQEALEAGLKDAGIELRQNNMPSVGQQNTPSAAGTQNMPQTGPQNAAPAEDGQNTTPEAGGQNTAPAVNGQNTAPAAVSQNTVPAAGTEAGAQKTDSQKATPQTVFAQFLQVIGSFFKLFGI